MAAHTREIDNYITHLARCTQLLNEIVHKPVLDSEDFLARAELALADAKQAEQILAAHVQQSFDKLGVPTDVRMDLSGGSVKTKVSSVVAGALRQAALESRPRR